MTKRKSPDELRKRRGAPAWRMHDAAIWQVVNVRRLLHGAVGRTNEKSLNRAIYFLHLDMSKHVIARSTHDRAIIDRVGGDHPTVTERALRQAYDRVEAQRKIDSGYAATFDVFVQKQAEELRGRGLNASKVLLPLPGVDPNIIPGAVLVPVHFSLFDKAVPNSA